MREFVFCLGLAQVIGGSPALLPAESEAGHTRLQTITPNSTISVATSVQMISQMVNEISQWVQTSESCTGEKNARVCDAAAATAKFNLPAVDFDAGKEKSFQSRFTIDGAKPTPWATMGNLHFYGNDYMDLMIFHAVFQNPLKKNGIFVETGGSNGVSASNTLFFEKYLGWTGILIEPTQCAVCALPTNRPTAKNVHSAICPAEKAFPIAELAGTFCSGPQGKCAAAQGIKEVPCAPMSKILAAHGDPKHIDFLSIDVEEHYMAVLDSIDWTTTQIDVIGLECWSDKGGGGVPACTKYLEGKGYDVINLPTAEKDLLGIRKGFLRKDMIVKKEIKI